MGPVTSPIRPIVANSSTARRLTAMHRLDRGLCRCFSFVLVAMIGGAAIAQHPVEWAFEQGPKGHQAEYKSYNDRFRDLRRAEEVVVAQGRLLESSTNTTGEVLVRLSLERVIQGKVPGADLEVTIPASLLPFPEDWQRGGPCRMLLLPGAEFGDTFLAVAFVSSPQDWIFLVANRCPPWWVAADGRRFYRVQDDYIANNTAGGPDVYISSLRNYRLFMTDSEKEQFLAEVEVFKRALKEFLDPIDRRLSATRIDFGRQQGPKLEEAVRAHQEAGGEFWGLNRDQQRELYNSKLKAFLEAHGAVLEPDYSGWQERDMGWADPLLHLQPIATNPVATTGTSSASMTGSNAEPIAGASITDRPATSDPGIDLDPPRP